MSEGFPGEAGQSPEQDAIARGLEYLGLLDLDHLANREFPGIGNMSVFLGGNFGKICGPHAESLLEGLKMARNPDHPLRGNFSELQAVMRNEVMRRLGLSPSDQLGGDHGGGPA